MKRLLFLLPAMACVALTLPATGHQFGPRTADDPDTAYIDYTNIDSLVPDEGAVDTVAVDSAYFDDGDTYAPEAADSMDYNDGDMADVDSAMAPAEVCPPDDELLSDFDVQDADYSYQDPADANQGAAMTATLYVPGKVDKRGGYVKMVSNILASMLDSAQVTDWQTADLDKMLENKWRKVKAGYQRDAKESGPMNYSYRTTVTPAWRFKAAGGLTTYKVEDEIYMGGAHGMTYVYYLTLSTPGDSLLGLTDIFKAESLPAVFDLVGKKLAARPNAPVNDPTWPQVAEITPAPEPSDQMRRSGSLEQFGGKWYPRPALTECGVVFSYQPYVKDCYAAGIIEVLLPYDEIAGFLKTSVR